MNSSTIPAEFRDRIYLISKKYNQHEIKGVIGTCDFFVGSRMHACIAALSQGIPTIGVAYSKKFRGVFESMNAGDWVIDARSTDSSSAVDKILAYIQKKGATVIPLELFWNRKGFAKLLCAAAVGKKKYDKRLALKQKEINRERKSYGL